MFDAIAIPRASPGDKRRSSRCTLQPRTDDIGRRPLFLRVVDDHDLVRHNRERTCMAAIFLRMQFRPGTIAPKTWLT